MLDVVSVVVRLVACDVVRDEVTEVAGVVGVVVDALHFIASHSIT